MPGLGRPSLYLRNLDSPQALFERCCEPQEVLGKRLAKLGRVVAPEETAEMPKLFSVGHQLPQAEEAKDRDHDHNGSDDPDDVVHGRSPGWHAARAETYCDPKLRSGKNMVTGWLI